MCLLISALYVPDLESHMYTLFLRNTFIYILALNHISVRKIQNN